MTTMKTGFVTLLLALAILPAAMAEEVVLGGERLAVAPLHHDDFSGGMEQWRTEGRGRVWVEDGRLQMDASKTESTAWFTRDVEGDILIRYDARILDPVDANNINLFFAATTADGGDVLQIPFTGAYDEYHGIPNYIMTFTDDYTRLRRDPGFRIVSENRRIGAQAHTSYQIAVMMHQGEIRCFINGQMVHSYRDPQPHRKGKVGFRSWHTRLWWDNLRIDQIVRRER